MLEAEQIDSLFLEALCEWPGPWSMDDLERVLAVGPRGRDAVGRLVSGGLVLRMAEDFVVASAAGRYAKAVHEVTP
jgi:hypothetical protein